MLEFDRLCQERTKSECFYKFVRCTRNYFSHKHIRKPKAEAAEMFLEKWKWKGSTQLFSSRGVS